MDIDYSPLFISLRSAFLATILSGIGGVAAARALVSVAPRRRFILEIFILIPLVLPPTVIGYGLLLFIGRQGPVGKMLLALHGETLVFTWWAGVLAATLVSFPVIYISSRAAFQQVDQHLVDAARIFGAGPWQRFLDILLPLARPGLIAGLLMSFARSLGEFGATLMVAGNIPGKTQTIPMAIYFAVEAGESHLALFWSSVAISMAALVLGLVQIFSKEVPERG